MWYKLNEQGEPVECSLNDSSITHIKKTNNVGKEKVDVSTIFLRCVPRGDLFFETMVFGGKYDLRSKRCGGNKADAVVMHDLVVKSVEDGTLNGMDE